MKRSSTEGKRRFKRQRQRADRRTSNAEVIAAALAWRDADGAQQEKRAEDQFWLALNKYQPKG